MHKSKNQEHNINTFKNTKEQNKYWLIKVKRI